MYDEGDRLSDSRVGNSLHSGNRIRFASEWTVVEKSGRLLVQIGQIKTDDKLTVSE